MHVSFVCFSSIDSVVCVRLFGALRNSAALHHSVIIALSNGQAGVTQEGVDTGPFFFFGIFLFFLTFLMRCLHFYREKVSAVPFSRQQWRRRVWLRTSLSLSTNWFTREKGPNSCLTLSRFELTT